MTESRRNELERTRRALRSNIYAYDANGKAQKAGRVLSHLCARLAPPPPFPVPAGETLAIITAALEKSRERLAEYERDRARACFSGRAHTPASIERETKKIRAFNERIGKLARMAAGREAFDAKYINPFGGTK